MSLKTLCACVALAATSACAAKTPVSGAADEVQLSSATAGGRATRNRDLITQQDLAADPTLKASTVLEVVRALRPQFLNDRGTTSMPAPGSMSDPEGGQVHASVNSGRILPLSELSELHANEIVEIRYLNVAQAMQKFGTAARQGPVILVTTTVR